MVKVATPDPFRVAVPRDAVPLRNVTVPVGVPAVEATVAVNVTLPPGSALVVEALSVVVVAGGAVTVMVVVPRVVLEPKLVSPE